MHEEVRVDKQTENPLRRTENTLKEKEGSRSNNGPVPLLCTEHGLEGGGKACPGKRG